MLVPETKPKRSRVIEKVGLNPNPKTAKNPKGAGKKPYSVQRPLTSQQKYQIVQEYEDGVSVTDIAEKHNRSVAGIYWVLQRNKELRETLETARISSFKDLISMEAESIRLVNERYMAEFIKADNISEAGIATLAKVWTSIMSMVAKCEDADLKRLEIELRNKELEASKVTNSGLISDFVEVIRETATMKPEKEDKSTGTES